jgi:hypothetical protein
MAASSDSGFVKSASASSSRLNNSPNASFNGWTFLALFLSLTVPLTWKPPSYKNRLHTCDPKKPVTPVITTFFFELSI